MSTFQQQSATNIPDLMTHLKHAYYTQLKNTETASAMHFIEWAEKYLDTNRPVESFAADSNHGIRLSNNIRVLVSPSMDKLRGTTMDAGSVNITTGDSQPGQEGVNATDSQQI